MKEIVRFAGNEPRVSTFELFSLLGYKCHSQLKSVVSASINEFNDLGLLLMQSQKPPKGSGGGRPIESYHLNNDQFQLLVLLCKNTPECIKLKVSISKELRRMKIASNH